MSLLLLAESRSFAHAGLAARSSAVTVDFDATVLAQIVVFVLLLLVLKPLVFDPMLKLFEEREKRILGAKLQARKLDEASAGALSKYEAEMQKARAAGNAERDKLRAQGAKQESDILGQVREATAKTLEQGRGRLHGELASARTALKGQADVLARELASRVLGRQVEP